MTDRLFSSTIRCFREEGGVVVEEMVQPITIDLITVASAYPALDDPAATVIECGLQITVLQCDYETFLAAWRRFHQRHALINHSN